MFCSFKQYCTVEIWIKKKKKKKNTFLESVLKIVLVYYFHQ